MNDNFVTKEKRTILIGVAGGSSSGKTSVCEAIMRQISGLGHVPSRVDMISMSSFYRQLTEEEQSKARLGLFNFDHPGAFDFEMMLQVLRDVQSGKTVSVPIYDMVANDLNHQNCKEVALVDVLLVEGILVFYNKEVRNVFDVKLFVDCDSDTRLARRVRTDIEKGRELESILQNYTKFVKPAFEEFCQPTKKYADLIMPRGYDNAVAVDIMVLHIRDFMEGVGSPNGQAAGKRNRQIQRHKSESSSKVSRPH